MLQFNPTIGLASGHPVDPALTGPAQQPLAKGEEKEHSIGKLLRLLEVKFTPGSQNIGTITPVVLRKVC
jgi:hypothetical protein